MLLYFLFHLIFLLQENNTKRFHIKWSCESWVSWKENMIKKATLNMLVFQITELQKFKYYKKLEQITNNIQEKFHQTACFKLLRSCNEITGKFFHVAFSNWDIAGKLFGLIKWKYFIIIPSWSFSMKLFISTLNNKSNLIELFQIIWN